MEKEKLSPDKMRIKASEVLSQKNKSDDLKLFEVFQIYKDDLKETHSQLYYALLGWKDSHLSELQKEMKEG